MAAKWILPTFWSTMACYWTRITSSIHTGYVYIVIRFVGSKPRFKSAGSLAVEFGEDNSLFWQKRLSTGKDAFSHGPHSIQISWKWTIHAGGPLIAGVKAWTMCVFPVTT